MAMIDYGALVKINGKIVNEDQFFMDMEQAVGWIDYPRIRYEDCNCLDDEGYSDCGECPRRQTKHYSDPELGEWDATIGDCRGNEIRIDGKIDGNYFAYVGDEDLTVAVYKTFAVITNKTKSFCFRLWELVMNDEAVTNKIVRYLTVNDVCIKIRRIGERQLYMTFRYKENYYEILYGYGIDSSKKCWDIIKHRYCDRKTIKFVDKFWRKSI